MARNPKHRAAWSFACNLALGIISVATGAAHAQGNGRPPTWAAASDFDGRLREQTAALQARALTLADLPRLQAAVVTDAATVRDLTQDELAFRPRSPEVIEIGQIPKNGKPVSLWKSQAASAVAAPLEKSGVHLVVEGKTLWLSVVAMVHPRERGDEIEGALAISAPVDIKGLAEQIAANGGGGKLVVNGVTIPLGEGPADGEEQTLALTSEAGRQAQLSLKMPRVAAAAIAGTPSVAVPVGVGVGVVLLIAILGLMVRGRKQPQTANAGPQATTTTGVEARTAGTGTPTFETLASRSTNSSADTADVGLAATSFNLNQDGEQSVPVVRSPSGTLRIGRYAIVKQLGSGGMADVYLARASGEAGFEKLVALKVMQKRAAQIAGLTEHFLDEARLASRLTHPNIVQILDLGRAGDEYFIAMEFVDGADLEQLLRGARQRGAYVPLRVAFTIISRMCDGLHAAHTATTSEGKPLELVHRDIKSANIFVGRNGVVKIGDFGIAKATQDARLHKTQLGEVKGTAQYMAPEHRLGEAVDVRADLYSVGAVSYELLTGTEIDLDLARIAHLGREGWPHLAPPSQVRPDLPPELDAILFKALAFQRDDRYADCAAFEAAVERVAEQHGLSPSDKLVAQWAEAELKSWAPVLPDTDAKSTAARENTGIT